MLLFLTVLIPIIYVSCTKDSGSNGLITISGITELDNSANNIGNIDITDWNFTDTWTLSEENLFKKNSSNNIVTEVIRPNSSIVVIGYPNPAKNLIYFAFQLDSSMYYDIRTVDNNLNIKLQFDSIKYSLITMKDSAYLSNELYRAYYKVYSDNKVYRGHGDFKFIK